MTARGEGVQPWNVAALVDGKLAPVDMDVQTRGSYALQRCATVFAISVTYCRRYRRHTMPFCKLRSSGPLCRYDAAVCPLTAGLGAGVLGGDGLVRIYWNGNALRPPLQISFTTYSSVMAKLIAVFLTIIASAAAWSPFLVPTMLSHQPIGSLPGEVNYYRIAFDVRSKNSGSTKSGYCAKFWGDNSELDPEPYSVYVPVDQWIQCDSAVDTYDSDSAFQFKLFPYFSIGNFSLEVKEQLHGDRT